MNSRLWQPPARNKPPYVTITHGMRGYFAVLVDGNDHDPIQSGIGSYAYKADAIVEAQEWAKAEGIAYVGNDG